MLLVGSRALALRRPEALLRAPRDFDFFCWRRELEPWVKRYYPASEAPIYVDPATGRLVTVGNVEFELADARPSTAMLIDLVSSDPETTVTGMGLVPSFDVLFTIKKSHRYLKNSVHFWKTLGDYHMMKKLGGHVPKQYEEFLKLREKETYSYPHPKLNQGKMGFFNGDQVTYVYDHDTVHEAVKLFDQPAYTTFQKDGAEVQVDRKKFDALPHERKLASVVEEATVLAIERSLVPFPGVLTEEEAWRLAFSKVLTSITSGWWREFAYENAIEALRMYPKGYWDRFNQAVETGIVKRAS